MALGSMQRHIYCVSGSPHPRAMRFGRWIYHTFPFSDDVNGWGCASTSLYVSIVWCLKYQDKYLMLHIFCAVVQVSCTHLFYFQIPHKALCGKMWCVTGRVYFTNLWYACAVFILLCSTLYIEGQYNLLIYPFVLCNRWNLHWCLQ